MQPDVSPTRPGVAFINPQQTPYRLHFSQRIVLELPQIKLHSVFTHEYGDNLWKMDSPPEVNPVLLGVGEFTKHQDKPAYALREWRRGGRIIRWLKQENVRAVVLLGYNDLGRIRVIRWCRRQGIAAFLFGDSNIRGDRAVGLRAAAKGSLVRYVIRQVAGCFCCGSLGREYFIKYGASPDRIYYMPYEPDYDLIFRLPPQRITQVMEKFQWSPRRRRLVFSARMTAVKRPDLLIDAFAGIASERPDWDVVMMGAGPLVEAMKGRVPPPLRDRVTWTGFLDNQELVSAVYRASDVLVLPSDFEPWALVINEAAAAGMAIVASDVVGAAAELVREGVNGRTFPAGSLSHLTQALREVTDPGRIEAMKRASGEVLSDWRRRGDPVEGLRRALVDAQVIAG